MTEGKRGWTRKKDDPSLPTWLEAMAKQPGSNMAKSFEAFRNAQDGLSSTNTQIGGTITVLGRLEEKIDALQRQSAQSTEPAFDKRLEAIIAPIKVELNTAQAQLAETKTSLGNMATFIAENRDALTTLISVGGRMTGIEAQVTSILTRLTKVEGDKVTSWHKTATIISIIVAVASIAVAAYFALT